MNVARRLLAWYDAHGRKTLPWKRTRDPYGIWVSEIMLQQTQVTTVIPYYERFMARFPEVAALARAPLDDVLHAWAGLGYYARARNLKRAAGIVLQAHAGRFPDDFEAVRALPGIGRSTAGAILALAFGQRHPICDGNVRRVLARVFAVAADPAGKPGEDAFWEIAARLTPRHRVADYTQAIMDLGATVCTRHTPSCQACPLARGCQARLQDRVADFPRAQRRAARVERNVTLMLIQDGAGCLLLERRPARGVWGGLWSLPECPAERTPVAHCRKAYGMAVQEEGDLPSIRHDFTHFRLHARPVLLRLDSRRVAVSARTRQPPVCMETPAAIWYNVAQPLTRGVPAPVKRLIQTLTGRPTGKLS